MNKQDSLKAHVIYFRGGVWEEFDPKHKPPRGGNPFETIQFYEKDTTLSLFNRDIACYVMRRNYCCTNGEYADHEVNTRLFIERISYLPIFEERTVSLTRTFWNEKLFNQYREDKLIRYEKMIPILK